MAINLGQLATLGSAVGSGLAEYQRPKQSMFIDANYAGNGLARTGLYQADLNANQRDPYDVAVMLGSTFGNGGGGNNDFSGKASDSFRNMGERVRSVFNRRGQEDSSDGSVRQSIDKYAKGYPEDWGSSSVGQSIGEYMRGYDPYSDYSSPVSNAIRGYEPYLNNLGIYGGY